jgi:predicted site-specific integrase-resolvase
VGGGRVDAIYARVSTRKQLDDLERQLAALRAAHTGAKEFSDCASGLNFKRKGLKAILQLAFEGRLRYVYVAHKDRLCRFAYDLIEHVLDKHGAKIVVDAQDQHSASVEQDLADDVLAVVTVFGARLHGRRSGQQQGCKRKRAEQQEAEEEDEGNSSNGGVLVERSTSSSNGGVLVERSTSSEEEEEDLCHRR